MASKYGAIHYYEDTDIEKWCLELVITKTLGIRTFWDMQQNQEIHKNDDWQDKMVEIEMRVSDMNGYKDIAFFHLCIIHIQKRRMLNLIMEKSCGFAMLYVTQSLYYVCCRSKAEKWRCV